MNLRSLVVKSRPTHSFLFRSHLWLGLQRPLFSSGIGKRGQHPLPAVPWGTRTGQHGCLNIPFHKWKVTTVWCSSEIFMHPRVQCSPVQYPWLMPHSNQTVQKRKQGCSGGQGQTGSFHRFPHPCSKASHISSRLPCTAWTTIHLSFFLMEITGLLESYQ